MGGDEGRIGERLGSCDRCAAGRSPSGVGRPADDGLPTSGDPDTSPIEATSPQGDENL